MSNGQTTGNLSTSISELTDLMHDTFNCCMKNYEALLPHLEKKDAELKIYHRLIQINVLLNKLNEELTGLRVEYVTAAAYDLPFRECRKRKSCDVPLVELRGTKNVKTEIQTFNEDESYFSVQSENDTSTRTENSLSVDNDRRNSQINGINRIKAETQLSLNAECSMLQPSESEIDINQHTNNIRNVSAVETQFSHNDQCSTPQPSSVSETDTCQDTSDIRNVRVTVHFGSDEENASVSNRIVVGTVCDKQANMVTEAEYSEDDALLKSTERHANDEQTCGGNNCLLNTEEYDNCGRLQERADNTTSSQCQDAGPSGLETPASLMSFHGESEDGAIAYNQKPCRTVDHANEHHVSSAPCEPKDELYDGVSLVGKTLKCHFCDVSLPGGEKAVFDHVKGKRHKRNQVRVLKSNSSDKLNVSCSDSDYHCTSSVMADTVHKMENNFQLQKEKHDIKLEKIWTQIPIRLKQHKKYLGTQSSRLFCFLCNEYVKQEADSIRLHIIGPPHSERYSKFSRVKKLQKSPGEKLLDIPGILKNIVPKTYFSPENNGFYCKLCCCFYSKQQVLNHMTHGKHAKKLSAYLKGEGS